MNLQIGNAQNKATRSAVTTSNTSSPMRMALDTKGSSSGIASYPYAITATTDPENLGVIRTLAFMNELNLRLDMLDIILRCGNQPQEHLASFLYLHRFVCSGGLLVESDVEQLSVKPPFVTISREGRVITHAKAISKGDQTMICSQQPCSRFNK